MESTDGVLQDVWRRGSADRAAATLLVTPQPATPAPAAPTAAPAAQPGAPAAAEMVEVFDQFGRRLRMPKEAWRTQILLPTLATKRDDAEALNGLIVRALRDGLAADVVAPARHLATIDPNQLRGATMLGVTLLQLGQHDEARRVLEEATARHGDDGVVLTNLAKAYAGLGDTAKGDQTLWRALEVDPNQDNGLLWYVALHKEQRRRGGRGGGAGARRGAAGELARPAVARARRAGAQRDGRGGAASIMEVLGRVTPVPTDALMQISGDLGNRAASSRSPSCAGRDLTSANTA